MITFNKDVDYNIKTLEEKFKSLAETRSFEYDPTTTLWVSKIFATIQGEAPLAGYPAIFLRLSGCNRGAKTDACFFCDTQFSPEKGIPVHIEQLIANLLHIINTNNMTSPLLVITGGEPMLQARALTPFIEELVDIGIFTHIQFETNGDMFKSPPVKELLRTIEQLNDEFFDDNEVYPDIMPINIVISPKRTISEPKTGAFLELAETPGVFLRLLISGDEDNHYYTVPQFLIDEWPANSFWLSPMTEYKRQPVDDEIVSIEEDIDLPATRRNISRTIHLANMLGYKVSLQAHSYIGIP